MGRGEEEEGGMVGGWGGGRMWRRGNLVPYVVNLCSESTLTVLKRFHSSPSEVMSTSLLEYSVDASVPSSRADGL